MNKYKLCVATTLLSISAMAVPVEINIDCTNPTVELAPHLYGLFFEDINFAADGGLYAELVQNRSFEYYAAKENDHHWQSYHPLAAWEAVERDNARCTISVENDAPLNDKNTNYLKINISKTGQAGVANLGFDGIPIDSGAQYDVSVYARALGGIKNITVALERADGTLCGQTEFSPIGKSWKKYTGVITADQTIDNARLVITTQGQGELHLDMVSLFPQDTFNGRKNGLRKDLAQSLKDLHPRFLRFPGGCIAHGFGLDNVYRWKDTVGDVAERKPNWNLWGYHQTYGLGYYEYFLLCEDLGAAALPVIPLGVSCGFRGPQECVPMGELGPWIDDALDLIEFANGSVDTEWGGLRAKMGHPKPFNLEFVCLGNEPHDNALFRDRFPPFVTAIREKYPEIKIIGTSGLGPEIPIYDLMTEHEVYSSDEHYYLSPQWYLANTDRYDNFDRSKPKIFLGEYASLDKKLFNAVSEAAYLTGIERNGDIVDMTCYAPLFGHRNHSQWNPDLIYFDHRTVLKTPSYYVQQLFAANKGDVYLANSMKEPKAKTLPTLTGGVGIGSWKTTIEVEEVKVNGKSIDLSKWNSTGGNFETRENYLTQLDPRAEAAMSFSRQEFEGDTVTYTLRARKTGGNEGFLVQFGTRDGQREDFWWNIGGWDNSRHALQMGTGRERSEVASYDAPGRIKTGEWYDLKVVLSPGYIKCYINEELIHDYNMKPPSISIAATLDKTAREIILKLVNPREEAVDASIKLNGVNKVAPQGKLMRIAGDRNSENTFDNPEQVKTKTSIVPVGKQFNYTLPPMSVQFIRIKAN